MRRPPAWLLHISPRNPAGIIKLSILLGLIVLLAIGIWQRWIPGRPVSPQWSRGNSVPDNALTYDIEEDLSATLATADAILSAPDFLFTMGEGSGLTGYDVLQVQADGQCIYRYPDLAALANNAATRQLDLLEQRVAPHLAMTRPSAATRTAPQPDLPWREARFMIAPDVVGQLRRRLVSLGYSSLKRGYRANVADGTQWFIRVRAGGREKAVWCDNHFPGAVIEINDFVREKIVAPNSEKLSPTALVQLPRFWMPDFQLATTAADPDKPDPDKGDTDR